MLLGNMNLSYDFINRNSIQKGWGQEIILISNDLYCTKLLHFFKKDNKFSYHFHKEKDETWIVLKGKVELKEKNLFFGTDTIILLPETFRYRVWPGVIHQLTALEDDTIILETSTKDSFEDNYRIEPGDSQK